MRLLTPAWERRERRKALAPAARAREGLTTMHRQDTASTLDR